MTHRQMATGGYACRSGLGGSPATGIRFPPELEWLPRREVVVVTCCLGVQVFEVMQGQTAAAELCERTGTDGLFTRRKQRILPLRILRTRRSLLKT